MSIVSLLKHFSLDYREALYLSVSKVASEGTSIENQLLVQGPKCCLKELMSFKTSISDECIVYIESLKLLIANNDPTRLDYVNQLIDAHRTLNEKKPTHREAFDSAFEEIICTCCSKLQNLKELEKIKIAYTYIKQRISTSEIEAALFSPFTSLLLDEIDVISLQEIFNEELMQKLKNLFNYIKDGLDFGLETDFLKDQAASLTIKFIENEILFKEMIKERRAVPLTSGNMSKVLLSEIQKIYPLSQIYSQRIDKFAQLFRQ